MTNRLLITGAAGFLGKALVDTATGCGAEVVAVTRSQDPVSQNTAVEPLPVDLGDPGSVQILTRAMQGVTGVIHAAASFTGDAATHKRDTVTATRHLVQALQAAGSQARLVLVSSLSVYDVAAMADHTCLDENSPLLHGTGARDAYAAAKLAQEEEVAAYAGPVQIIRPGVIYGPTRLWSPHLGFVRAGVTICPGGNVLVPAVDLRRAAAGLMAASLQAGSHDPVNLIDPNPPTQTEWLRALQIPVFRVPRGLVLMGARLLRRGPAWQARFRPLRYDTTKGAPLMATCPARTFAQVIAASKQQEESIPT